MADQDTKKTEEKDETKAKEPETTSVPIKTGTDAKSDAPASTPVSPSVPVPPGPQASESQPASGSLISETAADATPAANAPVTSAPAEPVVVASNDLPGKSATDGDSEKLAEEIEVLTGEIQALEAKIERLTSSATSAPADNQQAPIGDVAPISQMAELPKPAPEKPAEPPKPMSSTPEPETGNDKEFINKPADKPSMKPPMPSTNDIMPKAPSTPMPEPVKDEAPSSGGGMEIISEVVAVFGIIIFIVLAISPFFREILGDDTFLAVQQIGWLTALGTLGLGFLLTLFTKGKVMFKILLFLLLLVTAVVFLSLSGSSLVSSFNGPIDPFLNFYR